MPDQPILNSDALEAGAKALFLRERKYHTPTQECPEPPNWEDLTDTSIEHYRGNVRAVLAAAQPELAARLEQAEQAVERKQEALDTVARIVETQCEAVVLATDSQDLIGGDGDGDWDAVWGRLSELADAKRTAEQAVERVLALLPTRPYPVRQRYVSACDLYRALDGDPRAEV